MQTFFTQGTLVFGIISLRYLLIAGFIFWLVYVILQRKLQAYKIQNRKADRQDIQREIKQSILSSAFFAFFVSILINTPLGSYTQIYTDFKAHSIVYFWSSILLGLVVHDTYFYWTHRMMHDKRIYKYFHRVHHLSLTPTPFASYSFHALEAIVEAGIIVLIPVLIPVHPFALALFGLVSFMINVYGHLGYEVLPAWFSRTWIFKVLATATYHDLHHQKFNYNYGLYFRIWDRLMRTEYPTYKDVFNTIKQHKEPAIS